MEKSSFTFAEPGKYTVTNATPVHFLNIPENDPHWKCYLFGNTPQGIGMVYIPQKGQVPNWFVRWMMKVCLGCTWVKGR